jgi:23S rRNA pseudouridine1911/1915/1917 synthase
MLALQPRYCYMKFLDKESSIKILYLDNHVLVLNKPGGMLTQPDDSEESSLEEEAKESLKKIFHKEKIFLHAIHRLDKSVSGLVLFARSSKGLERLNEELRQQRIKKKYLALVEGKVAKDKDLLVNHLVHLNHRSKICSEKDQKAKRAELFYKVLKRGDDWSLLEIDLLTGRYHQIRSQLSALGHPVIGDRKYCSNCDLKGIKLHAYFLEFSHPVTRKRLTFLSIYPNSFDLYSFF